MGYDAGPLNILEVFDPLINSAWGFHSMCVKMGTVQHIAWLAYVLESKLKQIKISTSFHVSSHILVLVLNLISYFSFFLSITCIFHIWWVLMSPHFVCLHLLFSQVFLTYVHQKSKKTPWKSVLVQAFKSSAKPQAYPYICAHEWEYTGGENTTEKPLTNKSRETKGRAQKRKASQGPRWREKHQ